MNVLLIQPPDAPPDVEPRDSAYGRSARFVPSWDLLCLRAYLLNRTRFGCEFVDARLFTNLERDLAERIARTPDLAMAVVQTSSLGLGPAAAVTGLVRRAAPALKIAVCGQHPSQFPAHSHALHDADYAFCGDPEPILRNLMDCAGVEHRLQRVPGLRLSQQPPVEPYWLPDLKSLVLPDWSGVAWGAYAPDPSRQGALAEMRLSRGHTRTPQDRAQGNATEPLRQWPMERAANALQRCASAGIVELFLNDPPGFWTDARVGEWCAALDRAHNSQPWSFQTWPRPLSPDLIQSLQLGACRRIEFVFPSAQQETLSRYGYQTPAREFAGTVKALQNAGIEVQARIWVGGPEEQKGERDRVARLLSQLQFCPFSLHPFPLVFDSPLYREVDAPGKPALEAWIRWARDPWMAERPIALWGDQKARAYVEATMERIDTSVMNNPRHRLLRAVEKIRSIHVIESLENFALSRLRRAGPPPP
jgi:hypothetical protein